MASLTKVLQRGVDQAFRAIGDVAKPATWISVTGQPVIDIELGISVSPRTEYALKRVVFARFSQEEVDHDIVQADDQKCLFPRQDLPVEPANADLIRDVKGRVWQVKRLMSDPAEAVVIAQVRAS